METEQRPWYQQATARGKYRELHKRLCGLKTPEWKTSFSEIEEIIGFELPPSARCDKTWWANGRHGHTHALSWLVAGWETAEIDLDIETVLFTRQSPDAPYCFSLDDVWPVHHAGGWPEGLSLRREDMYEDRI